jgi:hypothetical protein
MVQTYKPPPNWPKPPPDWVPEPGWQPDPSWGPAPYGWKLWEDDDPPERSMANTPARAALVADARVLRQRALTYYFIAVAAALVVGTGSYRAVHETGVRTALAIGLLVVAALGFKAVRRFKVAAQVGHPLPAVSSVALGIVGLLALIPAFMTGSVLVGGGNSDAGWVGRPNAPTTATRVNTCWTAADRSGHTYEVACSLPQAKMIGVKETATPTATCKDVYVPISTTRYLCLSPR